LQVETKIEELTIFISVLAFWGHRGCALASSGLMAVEVVGQNSIIKHGSLFGWDTVSISTQLWLRFYLYLRHILFAFIP
jgi:hypothetical protein